MAETGGEKPFADKESPDFWHTVFSELREHLNYNPDYNPDEQEADFDPAALSALRLMREPDLPVPIHAVNQFSQGAKQRVYRMLLPPDLLAQFNINPVTWKGPDGDGHIVVLAPPDRGLVKIVARHASGARDPFAYLELADTAFNGVNVVLLVISDPHSPRFDVDISSQGEPTLFGTVHRNLAAEEAALAAGLAPAQIRAGLRASGLAMYYLEAFLMLLGHQVFYVEPLTYAAAVLFEKRGFSYVTGKKLMERIDQEFRPGGALHRALDGSTPFRQPEQWRSVRGRAWAIHDGMLSAIGERWDGVRMAKRLGRDAGVNTFLDAIY